jgi:signal transduction histidine kinase
MDAELDRTEFLRLLLSGDRREAERHASQLFEDRGPGYLYERVIQPALYEVGNLWETKRINVADEHLATEIAASSIASLYSRFPWPTGGPRVVLGCVEGERHELGARMVGDLLALNGWDERFLGSDVPIEHFVSKVADVAPSLVAISVTLDRHLSTARALVEAVRHVHPATKIIVGGLATQALDGPDVLGADAIAQSGSQAVAIARHWDSKTSPISLDDESPRHELERLREEWVAMVTHDLREAVHTIVLSTELLLHLRVGSATEAEARAIDRIRGASSRLGRMISDLADASQIASNRLSITRRSVELYAFLGALVEDQRARGRRFVLRGPVSETYELWVDPDRLHQIFENLFSNAAKYGDHGGEVRVDIVPRGDCVEVIITNDGPGIQPEQLPHVFERFQRARGAQDDTKPGLGLGLYIARGLVDALGGRLWAESVPGQWTAFHTTLPTRAAVGPNDAFAG